MTLPRFFEQEIRLSRAAFISMTVGLPLLLCVLWMGSTILYVYEPIPVSAAVSSVEANDADAVAPRDSEPARLLENELGRTERKIRALLPHGIYIVVDTGTNHLYVKKGGQVLHEAVCSTGSGLLLRDPEGGRQWIFDTPRGVFHVRRKAVDPVWTKPDWAFVEEGQPLPQKWSERIDEETLGEYALYFGDGYMIHGTLYQRYLGRSITHGCVRLGDKDLKRVYQMTPLGAPIYIF